VIFVAFFEIFVVFFQFSKKIDEFERIFFQKNISHKMAQICLKKN
jgi:hypothetical protein